MSRQYLSTLVVAILLAVFCVATTAFTFWETNPDARILEMKSGTHNPFREFNTFINDVFFKYSGLSIVPQSIYEKLGPNVGYYLTTYLRDLVMGTTVYWGTAAIWHFVIYNMMGKKLFLSKGRSFPTMDTLADQMSLAQASLLVYAALPILSEFLIENNLTRTYFYLGEVGGWPWAIAYFFMYIAFVEIGIYWMHRSLHENKLLYKYFHALHHKYNKDSTLTPWASIAFNPIDGILQASPYVVGLFFFPVHYYTHVFLLFFSGVWATNIHDSVPADTEPIMGAKYHTVHHTHYHYNYGQFFIFCDWYWGTLRIPKDKEEPEKSN